MAVAQDLCWASRFTSLINGPQREILCWDVSETYRPILREHFYSLC
jgi:hypothetical protein